MRIANFTTSLIYPGVALEIWIPGCKHKCKGCFNPELWDKRNGEELKSTEIIDYISFKAKWLDTIILTGGDPLCSPIETKSLILDIRKYFPKMNLWIYTGYTKEEIYDDDELKEIFEMCDSVVTDRYDENKPKTQLTGSNNQRIWKIEHINGSVRLSILE